MLLKPSYLAITALLTLSGCLGSPEPLQTHLTPSTALKTDSHQNTGLYPGELADCLRPTVAGTLTFDPMAWQRNLYLARAVLADVGIDLETYCRTRVTIKDTDCLTVPEDSYCYAGRAGPGWITLTRDSWGLVHEIIHVHLYRGQVDSEHNIGHAGWADAGYENAALTFSEQYTQPFAW